MPSSGLSQVILSAGDAEGSLQLRDLWTGTLLSSYKQYASALPASVALVASPKAGSLPRSLLTLPTTKPMIHAYALYKDQPTLRISAPEKLVAITTSVKGTFCAAASPEGRIHLWDLASGELLVSWIAHYRTIRALAFTDDEICLVSAGEDATVNVWSLSTIIRLSSSSSSAPKPLHTWTDHSLPVMALSLSSGPHTHARVFTCSLDQTVKVWSISTGLLLGSLLFPMPLHTLALAPTELAVYVAGPRRPGEVLRADLHRLRSHPQYPSVMRSIMQGKSGNDVVGIGLDQSVDTVQPAIYPITSSTATSSSSSSSPITIPSLALSLDGTMLVGGCSDGSLRIWDTTSRQLLRSILVNKGPIHALHTFLVDPADLMSPAKPKSQIPGPVPLQRSIRPGKEDIMTLVLTGESLTSLSPLTGRPSSSSSSFTGPYPTSSSSSLSSSSSSSSPSSSPSLDHEKALEIQQEKLEKIQGLYERMKAAVDALYQEKVTDLMQERRA